MEQHQSEQRVASTCNRPKINHHSLNQLQTLHSLLTKRLWGSSETPGVAQGNFGLISLSHSLAQHQKPKDKTLDSPGALILFRCTRNKKKNSSTRQIRLTCVTNSRQSSIKAEGRDALWDFRRSKKQKLSANVAIGLHSHPNLHQSLIAILSCGVMLMFSSQLFSSSETKCFFQTYSLLKRFPFARDDVKENGVFI